MKDVISQTQSGLNRSAARLMHTLSVTPDDRINWTPSPTARTPIQIAAHAAMSITGILLMLQLEPRLIGEFGKDRNLTVESQGDEAMMRYPFATVEEIDIAFRLAEMKYDSRASVNSLLDATVKEFNDWLETMTLEQFESVPQTFFGPVPMTFGITLPALHTEIHIAQIEYIQTIYGDLDRHPQ